MTVIDPGLSSKSVLITGGNSGIGAAIARAFASQGARIVLHFLDERAAAAARAGGVRIEHAVPGRRMAEAVAAELGERGSDVTLVEGDLLDSASVLRIFDAAGAVDILVNNAAHCELPDDVTGASYESLGRHFAVNAQAPAMLTAEFVRRSRQRQPGGA